MGNRSRSGKDKDIQRAKANGVRAKSPAIESEELKLQRVPTPEPPGLNPRAFIITATTLVLQALLGKLCVTNH